ncbi:hypothetical protein AKJ16_DCAP01040 [Drosera capensis]
MPGNENSDTVHNFFHQGNLSQNQQHTRAVEGNWNVLNNNPWGVNDRQSSGPFTSKNYNAHQSDNERAQGNQFALGSYGSNFTQSNPRQEFFKIQSQNQPPNLNGFNHAPEISYARQNEACNIMGMATESDQVHPSSRGFHMLDSQHRSGLQHSNSNSAGFRTVDSRVNFDFLGNQQQMTGQQAGPLLSMQSQQSGMDDMQQMQQKQMQQQQMQQQLMLKQIQELQRQHQLQQLEALRRNSLNQMSNMPNQRISHPSTLGSETSMHDGQSFPWQSPVMVGNPNWLQHGAHAAMQGYSNGVMITPEQGQALRMMGLVPQPGSHSLYGVPVSSPRAASPLHGQVDRPGMHQASVQNSSLSGNRHALFPEQSAFREGSDLPNSGFENKGSLQHGFGPGSGDADNVGFLNQNQQRNVVHEESGGKHDLTGSFETFPEKTVKHAASSQAAVALDPTEEKILFGSDDNIWEAFGGSLTIAAGSNNNTDAAFPSLQSGTWSALMQSAVAESDSSTVPPQEGWNGVGVHNSGSLATNLQNSFSQDSARHQVAWTDDSQAALRSKSVADNASIGHNTGSTSLPSFLNQRPSQQARSSQQSSQEGRNWLDNRVPSHGEGRQVENMFSSAELNPKGPTGHSGHQPNMPSQGSQLINRLNAFIVESFQQNGFMTAKVHLLDRDRAINTNAGHTVPFLIHDSASDANVGFSGPKYNRNDEAANHNPSIAKVNQDTGQLVSENHSYNFWRTVNSTQPENNESKNHQSVRGPQVLESSLNSSVRGGSEIRETGNADRRENFHDSHSFNVSHHSPSDSFRDNASSDISNMHLPGQKQTSSGLGGSKGLGPRKFQYHPMGVADMDGELVNRQKHPIYSEAMPHPFHEGFANPERQSIFSHPGLGKGLAPKNSVAERASYGHASSTSYSYQGHAPVASTSEKQSQSSQNMLELLHKVDQSDEQNSAKRLSSSVPTDVPEGEVSGGTVRHPKQSSGSQSFGLQLAPPSLGLPAPNFTLAGENSFQDDNSSGLNAVHSVIEDKANAWLPPGASFQSMPPLQQALDRGPWNEKSGSPGHLYAESLPSDISRESKGVGNSTVFASGSGYSRSHLQSQQLTDAGGKTSDIQNRQLADVSVSSTSQCYLSTDLASRREVSQSTNSEQYDARTSVNQTPSSAISAAFQPSVMYDATGNTNLASVAKPGNYVTQQHLSNQFMNASNLYMSRQHTNNSMEAHLSSQKEQDSKDPCEVGNGINSHAIVRGEENSERIMDAGVKIGNSVSESAATQKEIEAFGRSLRPKSHVPDDYSMLQHVQAVKDVEGDDNVRHMKRLKGSDTGPTAGRMYSGGTNFVIKDPSASRSPVTDGDAKKLDVTPEACNSHGTGRPLQVQHDTALMQDKLSVGQNLSGTTTPRFEHPQISPQMAPNWFDQFGSIKNEQMLPGHDAHKSPSISSLQQQFMISNSKNFIADQSTCQLNVAVRTDQIANSQHATPLIPGNLIFPLHPLASGALPQVPDSPRAKKRKSATDLVPWYKEVALGSFGVPSLSSAPTEWARAVNRLIEKPDDELDMSGDMMLVNRSRRRLIQTTQLMQQLLRPPPAGIMSLDASSNYETVTYFVARLALGEACSMACCVASNSHMDNGSSLSGKPMTSGRMRDQYLSKLAEDFINRAEKLEDMLRLDKQALTLDLRLECQDLERLSVINRFAKFHGRGQADGVETSSSSNTAAITQKPVPQRYVSAFPMPKNLPDGIQCLSL